MPPETSEEFQDMKEKINAIHQALFGYKGTDGFIEAFEKICTTVDFNSDRILRLEGIAALNKWFVAGATGIGVVILTFLLKHIGIG